MFKIREVDDNFYQYNDIFKSKRREIELGEPPEKIILKSIKLNKIQPKLSIEEEIIVDNIMGNVVSIQFPKKIDTYT